jgi:hypothetical protein
MVAEALPIFNTELIAVYAAVFFCPILVVRALDTLLYELDVGLCVFGHGGTPSVVLPWTDDAFV